jgi:hypothetical protein
MSDLEPAARPNGARALATLGRFLADDGWQVEPDGPQAFLMSYRGQVAFALRVEVIVAAEQLVVTGEAPRTVPQERRLAAAEYVTRAANGLYVGAFQLDLASGLARAHCGLDFEGEPLSPRLIRNAVAIVVRLMETYLPGLLEVIDGVDPLSAWQAAERAATP